MLSKLWSFIELRTNRMVQVCRWIIELGAFGLIVFVLIVIVKETSRPEIIIDAIDVPEDMVKSGYTGIVVAQKLADEAHNLSLKILEESDKSKYLRGIYLRGLIGPNYVKTNFAFSDISLPMTPFK